MQAMTELEEARAEVERVQSAADADGGRLGAELAGKAGQGDESVVHSRELKGQCWGRGRFGKGMDVRDV